MRLRQILIHNLKIQAISILFFVGTAYANEAGTVTGMQVPRFVTIKARDTNMRSGPGIEYPIKMNYKCAMLPVEILSECDSWRRVRDINGNEGWIHEAMLNSKRYVQIMRSKKLSQDDEEELLFRLPNDRSNVIAKIQSEALGKLIRCQSDWCNVSFGKTYKGWIHKSKLWGVYSFE